MSVSNVQVRIDTSVKKEAELVLEQLNLSLTEAIRLFLGDVSRNKRVPVSLQMHDLDSKEDSLRLIRDICKIGQKYGYKWLKSKGLDKSNLTDEELYELVENA